MPSYPASHNLGRGMLDNMQGTYPLPFSKKPITKVRTVWPFLGLKFSKDGGRLALCAPAESSTVLCAMQHVNS